MTNFGYRLILAAAVFTVVWAFRYLRRRGTLVFGIFKRKSIDAISKTHYDIARLKELTHILVVDDDPAAFPVSLLQAEGYNISYWSKVENLAQIERGAFDIVVLDIAGVAKKWSPDSDGLAVLRMIKKTNPGQYVISFSGQKSVHELKDFWTLSDDQLKKPASAEDCKLKIDDAMKERVNVGHYWNRIKAILINNGADAKLVRRIEKRILEQTEAGDKSESTIRRIASSVIGNEKIQELIATLAVKAVTAATK